MKQFYAYIRVSTARQGEQGVSLPQQREAIERYAKIHELQISRWFEERETAAKLGRPVFTQMLSLLRNGRASGVIIHKIDRSARNLKDWSDLGELIDSGIDVRFANDSVDLQSRGGRLSADIQAVVAADYIRNLREETRKGFYGRLKQGIYPRPAPLGYKDQGPGKPKTPDQMTMPLIRRMFELYASGQCGIIELSDKMDCLGLRTKSGGKVGKTVISRILSNPFYAGLIEIQKTGEIYQGAHQPIISASLFERARAVAEGRTNAKIIRHDFLFRRLVRCAHCGYSIIGEIAKGNIYYRCHTQSCPTNSVREEKLNDEAISKFKPLQFTAEEDYVINDIIAGFRQDWGNKEDEFKAGLRLQESQISWKLNRLADAYLDGVFEKTIFEERRTALLLERQKINNVTSGQEPLPDMPSKLEKFLELAKSAYSLYLKANPYEKRDLLEISTSNRELCSKTPVFTLDSVFREVANRQTIPPGSATGNRTRIPTLKAWCPNH